MTIPVLIAPCLMKPFHFYVDASIVAIRSLINQKDEKDFDHLIYYASQQLVVAV